jgi:hypothetical protein
MDSNNLNDISKIYLEKVSTKLDEKKKEKPKFWWDDDGNGIGYEEGEVSGKFKKKKIKEALIGRQTEIDANRNGEIDAHDFKILRSRSTKKKKQVKEGFSNWREDLVEIADKISPKETDQKIVEKEVIKEVPVEIIKEVIIEKIVEKEVIKEVPVEKIVEIIKEVPIEIKGDTQIITKEIIKEIKVEVPVVKEVTDTKEIEKLQKENEKLKAELEKINQSLDKFNKARYMKNSDLGSLYSE